MKSTSTALFFALVGFAAAECPNACSGHGTCGAKDECSCYQNYQGNDCSERTCYFGIAHVDTPKGDLNADGYVSGPLTTVITGSEVYPWGTTEQYPNADANEGHFYMECSNKGICDRKTGTCDCFDGYEGTACVRASCPNECSGHGTCESIKEIAEQKSYNTNKHDVPTTTPVGSTNHHNFDLAIEESYAYDLWDQDKTMGCKCDPVYYGADCSLKKCKYGVDPLFYDNSDGVIYQTTVIHLGSKSTGRANIGGTFRIVFYDVFGEKYVTKHIDATRTSTNAGKVREALEALPNGVIAHSSTDITATPPSAVTVSMAAMVGTVTKTGTIGAGTEGSAGAGLGATGADGVGYGPEFTVTFSTNPGILKSIELDTREINNQGTPDYWVANTRQGQFSSRYSTNLGRVNTLKYGSKLLYTNSDWSGATNAAAQTLVKIGGQEARVTAADAHHLTLSEPYLGASIIPVLTDTGVTSTALAAGLLTHNAPGTTIIANHLKSGAKLYLGGCPFTSSQASVLVATTTTTVAAHDCHDDITSAVLNEIVYRRSDDPSNQNLYRTTGDTGTATQALHLGRGSADVYTVGLQTQVVKQFKQSDSTFTLAAALGGAIATNTAVFVNGIGPIVASGGSTTTIVAAATGARDFFLETAASADVKFPVFAAIADTSSLSAGTILQLGGRRYKVKSRNDVGTVKNAKVTLTENWAGGQLLEVCSACLKTGAAAGTSITSTKKVTLGAHDKILVGGYTHEDLQVTVSADVASALSITTSKGTHSGSPAIPLVGIHTTKQSLYRVLHTDGYVGTKVVESATATTFQYVSQCSNRGSCDSSTGVCKCFKGYSNDNCDNQNMLAM